MQRAVARWSAKRRIVLRATVHPIEWLRVVHRHLVELGQRQVREELPRHGAVERLVQPAVASDQVVIGVGWIDPDDVIVDVLVLFAKSSKGAACVIADHVVRIDQIDPVNDMRIRRDFGVVQSTRRGVAHARPARADVGRAVHATLAAGRLDDGVDHVRILRTDRQTDAPEFLRRQAGADLRPRHASVGGAMNRALRPSADLTPDSALPHVRCRDENVGVSRIDLHIVHADPVTAAQHPRPCLAAVRGLVQSALPASAPCRSLRRDVDHVAVVRVDDDPPDVFRCLESGVDPTLPVIHGLVDAVAVSHRTLVVVLARAHPHRVWIVRVDGHRADGVRRLCVEHRCECRAGVGGLPHAAARRRDVPRARRLRVNRQVTDAP